MNAAKDKFNLMAYAGLGYRTSRLDTSDDDYMNHRGRNSVVGIRMDRALGSSMSILSDIGYRYYWDTDDLDPSGENETSFGHLVTSPARLVCLSPAAPLPWAALTAGSWVEALVGLQG